MKTEKELVELADRLVDSIYKKIRNTFQIKYETIWICYETKLLELEKEINQLGLCDLKKSYDNARINDTLRFFRNDIEFGTSETKQDFRETILTFITEYYDNKINKNADRKQHLALFIINAVNYFTKKDLKIDEENRGKLTILKN